MTVAFQIMLTEHARCRLRDQQRVLCHLGRFHSVHAKIHRLPKSATLPFDVYHYFGRISAGVFTVTESKQCLYNHQDYHYYHHHHQQQQ
jgi:hypothetical protein